MESNITPTSIVTGQNEVLIEIDGKFKLVSATDMEAIGSPLSSAKVPCLSVDKEPPPAVKEPHHHSLSISQEPVHSLPSDSVQDTKIIDTERPSIKPTDNSDSLKNDNTRSSLSQDSHPDARDITASPKPTDAIANDTVASPKSTAKDITANLNSTDATDDVHTMQLQQAITNPIPVSSSDVQKPAVRVNSKEKIPYPMPRWRTKSAPGHRLTDSKMEEERRKKQNNDIVYRAWLDKKNMQLSEERKMKVSHRILTQEEILMKKEQAQSAYKAWMAHKDKLDEKKKERCIKSATPFKESELKRSMDAYNAWLEHKRLQKQRDQEMERKKLKEEEEAARRVDSDTVHEAYQQ